MAREVHNGMDIIDSRDVIERIKELESEFEDAQENHPEDADIVITDDGKDIYESDTFTEDDYNELQALKALAEEASGCADWEYGETLIREDYFEEYAYDLACDIGAISRDANWPVTCIDWEKAADELKADYTSVDFDGVTYWIRS